MSTVSHSSDKPEEEEQDEDDEETQRAAAQRGCAGCARLRSPVRWARTRLCLRGASTKISIYLAAWRC